MQDDYVQQSLADMDIDSEIAGNRLRIRGTSADANKVKSFLRRNGLGLDYKVELIAEGVTKDRKDAKKDDEKKSDPPKEKDADKDDADKDDKDDADKDEDGDSKKAPPKASKEPEDGDKKPSDDKKNSQPPPDKKNKNPTAEIKSKPDIKISGKTDKINTDPDTNDV